MQVKDIAREDDGDSQELVLTMVASAEEVDENAKKFFKEIAQRDIPGFRKGKAPRQVLEQSVGGHNAAMGGVAEMLINELAFKAIDDADIIFLADPQFNVDDQVEEGKPFTFTVSGKVAPVMKLSSYDEVSIEMPPEEATDEEVEAQLKALQDFYHSFEDIDDADHAAEMGDYVMLQLTVTNEDKPLAGLHDASRMVGLGEGTMPASFDEKIIGAKVGDVLSFDFEAKAEDGTSEFGDGNLHAVAEVKSFRRCIVPAIDDELAHKVGCVDEDDMRKQMRHTINQHKNEELPKLMTERVAEQLIARLDGEVPAYYTEFIRQDVGREFMQGLQKQGTNLQEWLLSNQVDSDEMKEQVENEAKHRAAIDCALEALFAEKGWEVTEEDIMREIGESDDAQEIREKWEGANRMADLRKMCRHSIAMRWLVKTANVTVVE